MRHTRKQSNASTHEVALRGRRRKQDTPNSLQFFARIEGETDHAGHVRGANGIRWRIA